MSDQSNDICYDYINQDLLYLLLIKGCSIAIRPFEYESKLNGFLEILRIFYLIEEIDMNKISDPSLLEAYFSQYDDSEKKSLILLKNVNQDIMNEVKKYPEIIFIALEKNMDIDYSQFQKIAVFNRKIKKFDTIIPESILSKKIVSRKHSYKWVDSHIVSVLKTTNLFDVQEYLIRIKDAVYQLFELLPTISVGIYVNFCQLFSAIEQKVIVEMTKHYFNVKMPNFTKKTVARNDSLKDEEISEVSDVPTNFKTSPVSKSITDYAQQSQLLSQSKSESGSESDSELESNLDIYSDEIEFSEEIWDIMKNNSAFMAFSMTLHEIDINKNLSKKLTTPEQKYTDFRLNKWKNKIPIEFFEKLLLYYIREEIKNETVIKSKFKEYLKDKHNQLCQYCSMIATPEFKKIDPVNNIIYYDDEIIKSYLKKDPTVSNILPVEPNSKNANFQTPSDLEQIISQAQRNQNNCFNKTIREKPSFKDLYQQKLKQLKEEYVLTDPDLITKLRAKTKYLEEKFINLFS